MLLAPCIAATVLPQLAACGAGASTLCLLYSYPPSVVSAGGVTICQLQMKRGSESHVCDSPQKGCDNACTVCTMLLQPLPDSSLPGFQHPQAHHSQCKNLQLLSGRAAVTHTLTAHDALACPARYGTAPPTPSITRSPP